LKILKPINILIKEKKTHFKNIKIPNLTKEDGQPEKLKERKIIVEERFKSLFNKDVNNPSERGYY
tara:strand:+ start:727 stop:921 length:195 start_codon:yes stop_codon:yes gene_type:complete